MILMLMMILIRENSLKIMVKMMVRSERIDFV